MLLIFADDGRLSQAYYFCLLLLFSMIDICMTDTCPSHMQTVSVYNEEILIRSPNYPGEYPRNCDWIVTFTTIMDYLVLITFEDFDMAPNDYLAIYDKSIGLDNDRPEKT